MAIYDVDAINEQELAAERDDILDNMLEACDQMLSALDESTAAQRHSGMTSKNLSKFMDGNPVIDKVYGKKNLIGSASIKAAAKELAKYKHDPEYKDKQMNKAVNATEKTMKKFDPDFEGFSDREKEVMKVKSDASQRAAVGATMSKAAKAGYDVKGAFDKANAKAAKKKAIKETCLTILSVLDEI